MVSIASSGASLNYLNATANRIQSSITALSSGTVSNPALNTITTAQPTANSDTSDLLGITNPDDPNNTNPPNVSYNVAPQVTSNTTQSGGDVDVAAEQTALSTATTQFSFGVEAQKQANDQKKQLLNILT